MAFLGLFRRRRHLGQLQGFAHHRALVQVELNEVNAGVRKLTDRDFLGPKERERRRLLKAGEKEGKAKEAEETGPGRKLAVDTKYAADQSKYYFDTLQKLLEMNRIKTKRREAFARKRVEKRKTKRRTARQTARRGK